jgi:hypothetical protein
VKKSIFNKALTCVSEAQGKMFDEKIENLFCLSVRVVLRFDRYCNIVILIDLPFTMFESYRKLSFHFVSSEMSSSFQLKQLGEREQIVLLTFFFDYHNINEGAVCRT